MKMSRGIYLRGMVYWFAIQKNKKRHFISLETNDLAVAVRRVEELRDHPEIKASFGFPAEIEKFIDYKVRMNAYSRFSADEKGGVLHRFATYLGPNVTPAAVTPSQVQSFYDACLRRVSASTANGYIMTLRSFFRWCQEVEGTIRRSPAASVQMAKVVSKRRERHCTVPLRDRLIQECKRPDLKFILFCGFHAGLRRNEIIEARPDWFDLENNLLHVRKTDTFEIKDKEERTIPLTREFSEFLGEEYPFPGKYCVAPDVERGISRYRWDFHRPFTEYMESQDCDWITIHTMRHTFASLLASAGKSIFKIATWLGDDVRVVQKHYAKLNPKDEDIEVKG